ncbi:sensor histidine kinase [Plantibacter sp. YIM 135249]|uniref:sensor histidine kinase n=1 Tax=Plantibacter sp. YIM 135249 TaxID=3423918 RepID=UPI003D346F7C
MKGRHLGIRGRIAGGSFLIALVVSLLAGLFINAQLERIVRDGTLEVLQSNGSSYVFALQTRPVEGFRSPSLGSLIAVVAPDGSTPVFSLPTTLLASLPTIIGGEGITTIDDDGVTYLLYSTPVAVDGENWHVVTGRNADEETSVLVQMRVLLVGSLAIVPLGVGVAAWFLTTVSLVPVTRLRTSAETLSDQSTDELLPVGRSGDEISRLATTLNDLIERLRASAVRERQLVSDASHELRTPLAILRTQLELARTEASSMEQLLDDIDGAEQSAARLSTLLTSLLELSRIESGMPAGRASAIDLDREAVEAVDRARFRAIGEGRAGIETSYRSRLAPLPAGAEYGIRAEDFGRVVDNLTGNALQALAGFGASAGAADAFAGSLAVTLEAVGDAIRLTVEDTGGGMDPAFEVRALERFSRADDARTSGEGAGLGLAIVAAIVRNAGGTIELRNRPGTGLGVIVVLPVASERGAPAGP